MRLNPCLIEQLSEDEEYIAGKELDEAEHVRVSEESPSFIRYHVAGNPGHNVVLQQNLEIKCDCENYMKKDFCRHVMAAWLTAERNRVPDFFLHKSAQEAAQDLTTMILRDMPGEANIQLEVTMILPRRAGQDFRLGLRIGSDKLFVVKDVREFILAIENKVKCTFSKGFIYEPEWMRFSDHDKKLLHLIRQMMTPKDLDLSNITPMRFLRLPSNFLKEFLDLAREASFRVMDVSGNSFTCKNVPTQMIPLQFEMNLTPRGLSVVSHIPPSVYPLTAACEYILLDGKVVAVEEKQQKLVEMLSRCQYDGKCYFDYPLKETSRVIGEVFPYLKLRGAVELSEGLKSRLVRVPLKSSVYLDQDGHSIMARVSFAYGDTVLNPFGGVSEKITLDKGEKLLLRDAEAEHAILDILSNAGFKVNVENIRLINQEAIFRFINEDVKKLQKLADVYLSKDFKRIAPRRPMLSGTMRLEGDRMTLALNVDGEPTEEILSLLEALGKKRKYFRMKDGSFLDLSCMEDWQDISANLYETAIRDGNDPERDEVALKSFRACYLIALLEKCKADIRLDESILKISRQLNGEMPEAPDVGSHIQLRDYQLRGYSWMYMLDQLHMGGVLADDMGLGKTIQVISLLRTVMHSGRTSMVVTPTSLTYNWLSEINRFAPELSAVVLSGSAQQRANVIRHVIDSGDVDVLITSYPMIRRDIGLLKDYAFRFLVLDEAQNIKNAGSIAAATVKQLKADTRYALTGTPMENGIGELWSIFDFVLPGYLPNYHSFLRQYQDGENAEDLKYRIRPFLTRRLKQDVLEELPDKIETILRASMTQEQKNVYMAAMERIRPKINTLLEEKGVGRGRMEVLSALTELRQICCHPSLVLNEYTGGSGKEEMLLDILPELLSSGRRILLFSQFTSMLKLLIPKLDAAGYTHMYLDGDTPADDRVRMTEEFNRGDTQIFLISLRAGGSGLNLTGADTVIHYDPWWNPAAEDQATDRAHRIGQTHKVEVMRLVTGESIEEQVVELGSRKKALFDRLITPGEAQLNALTEQDIRSLFM